MRKLQIQLSYMITANTPCKVWSQWLQINIILKSCIDRGKLEMLCKWNTTFPSQGNWHRTMSDKFSGGPVVFVYSPVSIKQVHLDGFKLKGPWPFTSKKWIKESGLIQFLVTSSWTPGSTSSCTTFINQFASSSPQESEILSIWWEIRYMSSEVSRT